MSFCIFILAFVFFQDIPLKPGDEFEVKLDYAFRHRPPVERNTVFLGESVGDYGRRANGSLLPYLVLNIELLKLAQPRMRMLVSTNLDERRRYRKVNVHDTIALDLGFTDDMVDRVTAHHYIVTFLTLDRRPVNKIIISVEGDGSFLVNGEKRGRF